MDVVEVPQDGVLGVSELFELALDRLDAERAAVSERMLSAIADGVAEYPLPEDGELLAEVYSHCADNLEMFCRATRERRMARSEELDFVREVAVKRVGKFLPLDAVLHAYRVGLRAAWSWLIQQPGDTPEGREAALELTFWSMQYVDSISQAVAEAYLRAHQRVLADADRTKRELLEDLLAGRFRLDDPTRSKLAALGLEPSAGHQIIVALPEDPERLGEAAETLHRALTALSPDPLIVPRRDEVVALAPSARGADAVRRALQDAIAERDTPMLAGVSTVCAPLTEAPRGYEEAARALRRCSTERRVVSLADLSLFGYLTEYADATARGMVPAQADALLEEDRRQRGDLVATLEAYVACDMHVGRTAEQLVVHPNTVHYRLGKIAKTTGITMRSVADVVELLAGIRIRRS